MSKERLKKISSVLEDIELIVNNKEYEKAHNARAYCTEKHGKWIVNYAKEQAERVEELEDQVDSHISATKRVHKIRREAHALKKQNKRYREVILVVNEELITLLTIDNLTDDEKLECIKSAKRQIDESLEGDSETNKLSRLVQLILTLICLSFYFYVRLNIPTEVIR